MDFGAANEKTHHIPNCVPLHIHFFSVAVMSYPTKCSVEKGLMWLPALLQRGWSPLWQGRHSNITCQEVNLAARNQSENRKQVHVIKPQVWPRVKYFLQQSFIL